MQRKTLALLLFILVVAGCAAYIDWPHNLGLHIDWLGIHHPLKARLGLDLQGGVRVLLEPEQTPSLGGETLADGSDFWDSIREQRHEYFTREPATPLWRLSVRSTAPYTELGSEQLIEWGGGLRWLKAAGHDTAQRLRAWASEHGGHATLFRAADKSPGVQISVEIFEQLHEGVGITSAWPPG